MSTDTIPRRFGCAWVSCWAAFDTEAERDEHFAGEHEGSRTPAAADLAASEAGVMIPCWRSGCPDLFESLTARDEHYAAEHRAHVPGPTECTAPGCTRGPFATVAGLRSHQRSHENAPADVVAVPAPADAGGGEVAAAPPPAPAPRTPAGFPCRREGCTEVLTSGPGRASHERWHDRRDAGEAAPPRAIGHRRERRHVRDHAGPNVNARIHPELRELLDVVAFTRRMTLAAVLEAIVAEWADAVGGRDPALLEVVRQRLEAAEDSSPDA